MRILLIVLLTLTILLAACNTRLTSPAPEAPQLTTIEGSPAVAGEILVKYEAGLATASLQPLAGTVHLASFGNADWGTLALVKVPEGSELDYARDYAAQAAVTYAEPNYWVASPRLDPVDILGDGDASVSSEALDGPVTDPYFVNVPPGNAFDVVGVDGTEYSDETYLWGIHRVRAPESWEAGYTGEGVVVAVIDEGIDLGHPDLAPNLWTNPNPNSEFCPGVNGYDFVDDDTDPTDSGGHGTHVAGTIAAAANDVGVVGVAPQAQLMALRGLGYFGGTSFMLVRALKYAADCGAQVVNNSWGGSGRSKAFEDVLHYGTQLGTTYVFAAGNSYLPANPPQDPVSFSTTIPGVIGVGATSTYNDRMTFSSAGDYVTVGAPGGTILSTFPVGVMPADDPYRYLQGTSMAAPHVAGVVALLYQAKTDITPEQVREALEATANSDLTAQENRPDYTDTPIAGQFGYGLVDAMAAVDYAVNLP
jgi:subtilisin family serine protease